MKTIQIIGENLYEKMLIAITSQASKPAKSFAIDIKFIEDGKICEEKLVIHHKDTPFNKSSDENIFTFTGTLLGNGPRRECIGYLYAVGPVYECWMTIITKPKSDTFTVNISKKEFIEKCKEYGKSAGMETDQNGNLKKGFPIFRNAPQPGDPGGVLMNGKQNIRINLEMYNNLFPIEREDGVVFGEYIEEYLIKICSQDEATLRGIKFT